MELTFEITDYQQDALFDDFMDGTSGQYDAAGIRILSGDLTGRTIYVYVPAGSPEAARWREIGKTVSARVDSDDFLKSDMIFSGAFVLAEEAG